MGVFKGSLTVRRYRVIGEVPEDFRVRYPDAMNDHAHKEPRSWEVGVEAVGWCHVHNLLDTDFTVRDRWLYNHYITAAVRVDKKALPARLFKAHMEKRIAAWCQENGRARAPKSVREEQKQLLEQEMLVKTLPSVATTEFCWNVIDGYVTYHATAEASNDRFRKLFRATFGLVLAPFSPLDFLTDQPEIAHLLESAGISEYRPAPSQDEHSESDRRGGQD